MIEMPKLSVEDALTILEQMENSYEDFTEEQKKAILVLGVGYKMGTLTPEQNARFEAICGHSQGDA